jgi:hypothetical protein
VMKFMLYGPVYSDGEVDIVLLVCLLPHEPELLRENEIHFHITVSIQACPSPLFKASSSLTLLFTFFL